MRAAGPLPIPAPDTAGAGLAERRARLARRLAEVERKAETNALEDVQLSLGRLRISPLTAITPEEADTALAPLYAHLPNSASASRICKVAVSRMSRVRS